MFKKLRYYFTEYFTFTKRERNGILILLFLICLVLAFRFSTPFLFKPESNALIDSALIKEAADFQNEIMSAEHLNAKLYNDIPGSNQEPIVTALTLFDFDPNSATPQELMNLGLSSFIVNNICEFRNKGGEFNDKEDLKRIYGLTAQLYNSLEPYIVIEEDNNRGVTNSKPINNSANYSSYSKIKIEINSADEITLKRLPGVGEILSPRLIKFRDLLGGFYSIEQLHEVYGFTDSLIAKVQPEIYIDTNLIHKININVAELDELKDHPYVTDYEANSIIFYRSKVGKIKQLKELTDNNIVSDESFKKIYHYLAIN